MGKRKPIGETELDFLDNKNSKSWLQNEFLATIRKLEPDKEKKPLTDLAKQPLEQYKNFVEGQDRRSISRRRKVSKRWEDKVSGKRKMSNSPHELSYFSLLDEDDPLRKSIQQWGDT